MEGFRTIIMLCYVLLLLLLKCNRTSGRRYPCGIYIGLIRKNINNPEFDNALKAIGMEKLMEIIIKAQTEKKTMLEIGSICCGIKEFQCLASTGQGKGIAALVKSLFNSVRVWFSSVGNSEA